jgi:predicted DNA-binding protein (MmcQ/YjbR family)
MAKKASKRASAERSPQAALERLSRLIGSLPEATAEAYGDHTSFRVRTKTFGYFVLNHHGDGRVALVIKVPKGDNEYLVLSEPERFYRPAYLAKSGWVSMAFDRGPIDWPRVDELLRQSYRLQAPKTLAAKVPE